MVKINEEVLKAQHDLEKYKDDGYLVDYSDEFCITKSIIQTY